MNYETESLKMHYDLKGKIEVTARAKVGTKEALSLAYTPGVAKPCLEIQKDISKSYELTRRWNTVAVITDGTAVLGLGDIGPEAGMPVMEGKCVLFKEFGDVDAIPLCIRSKEVDEIVEAVRLFAGSFGGINLEDMKIVTSGAGAAGIAIIRLLMSMGLKNVVMTDRKGAIYEGREGLNPIKEEMAKITNFAKEKGTLAEVIKGAAVVSTGRSDYPNQVNNVLCFSGMFRGALDVRASDINDEMKVAAAYAIAGLVSDEELSADYILPAAFDPRVKDAVAKAVGKAEVYFSCPKKGEHEEVLIINFHGGGFIRERTPNDELLDKNYFMNKSCGE